MSLNKNYAVFGLGSYGMSVAKELSKNGAEVLGVDINPDIVDDAAAFIPVCKCADVTDAEVIKQLGISNMDVVIIAMANSLEASVMAITLCKEAGVACVVAKCSSEMHQKIMKKVGADTVVFPEQESGVRLAKNLISSGFIDIIDLSTNISMVELGIRPEWVGKSLIELNLRKKYSINVVAIRNGDEVSCNISPEMPLQNTMKLIVIADITKLSKLR